MSLLRVCLCFFKQKASYEMRISDWSSDVCSSDLQCCRGLPSWSYSRIRMSMRSQLSSERAKLSGKRVDNPQFTINHLQKVVVESALRSVLLQLVERVEDEISAYRIEHQRC